MVYQYSNSKSDVPSTSTSRQTSFSASNSFDLDASNSNLSASPSTSPDSRTLRKLLRHFSLSSLLFPKVSKDKDSKIPKFSRISTLISKGTMPPSVPNATQTTANSYSTVHSTYHGTSHSDVINEPACGTRDSMFDFKELEVTLQRVECLAARKPGIAPRMWTAEEDRLLMNAVAKLGTKSWKRISQEVPSRTHVQCLQRYQKVLRGDLVKGPWSNAEDALLLSLIQSQTQSQQARPNLSVDGDSSSPSNSNIEWKKISEKVSGRSAKQCKERWELILDPSIDKTEFSVAEDEALLSYYQSLGSKWSTIAKQLPGRTENQVKTRFNSLMRRETKARGWGRVDDCVFLCGLLHYGQDFQTLCRLLSGRSKSQLKKRFEEIVLTDKELNEKVAAVEKALEIGRRNGFGNGGMVAGVAGMEEPQKVYIVEARLRKLLGVVWSKECDTPPQQIMDCFKRDSGMEYNSGNGGLSKLHGHQSVGHHGAVHGHHVHSHGMRKNFDEFDVDIDGEVEDSDLSSILEDALTNDEMFSHPEQVHKDIPSTSNVNKINGDGNGMISSGDRLVSKHSSHSHNSSNSNSNSTSSGYSTSPSSTSGYGAGTPEYETKLQDLAQAKNLKATINQHGNLNGSSMYNWTMGQYQGNLNGELNGLETVNMNLFNGNVNVNSNAAANAVINNLMALEQGQIDPLFCLSANNYNGYNNYTATTAAANYPANYSSYNNFNNYSGYGNYPNYSNYNNNGRDHSGLQNVNQYRENNKIERAYDAQQNNINDYSNNSPASQRAGIDYSCPLPGLKKFQHAAGNSLPNVDHNANVFRKVNAFEAVN